ncbi:MAG: 50S ribosomal protein L9 [Candidatus Wildermuthbacteria bacterium RIFCSPHIGHO2_02_FULL_49_9]|uniref:Large ribosomal subunit protein bL9 n=2 Tax=Candidatus Wildermuthiibacteriota TaxID=1817923 RepID=A0A1G2QW54_9BACT|nr:MAG: 50S ribosomal protein L9 [Candidatus Wildermuthbacteria bacterium RIFCSPHIGHO2_01_FULL_49_22b]OHA70164.1 MAG: 50S ribosomal protein L9 [Candidatus Wildermuthbacteria bacterium RIFCSPHIGHO2_02_FULL_49_9]
MKVILLQDIPKLGRKFEVREVADGHAANRLIPEGLVKPATKEALEWLEMQKELHEKAAEESLGKSQDIASQLDDTEVQIAVKVGEEGQLFEGINAQKIAERLKELGYDIKKSQIKLEEPIKELGEFPVKIVFEHNLEAEIRVIIAEEQAEE